MNVRRALLRGLVAVSFGALLAACTARGMAGIPTADKQSSARGTKVGALRVAALRLTRRRENPTPHRGRRHRRGAPGGRRTRLHERGAPRLLRAAARPPAWIDEHGPARPADDLVDAPRLADLEGSAGTLPTHRHRDPCRRSTHRRPEPQGDRPDRWAEIDLLLTNAFLLYGSHLLAGRVNPKASTRSGWRTGAAPILPPSWRPLSPRETLQAR